MWFWVNILHTGAKIHEMHQKYIERNCVGMRDVRGEGGRWPPPLWAHWDRQAGLEKCSNSLYKWHPERLVSQHTTLIPLLGLCSESLTPTYTVNGKVTFEKWGPHRDLIHWLTPGRGASPPGEAVWFRLRLHFGLDLLSFSFLTFSRTHIHMRIHSDKLHFNFIMEWSIKEAKGSENVSWMRFMFNIHLTKQTNTAMVSIYQRCTTFQCIPLDKLWVPMRDQSFFFKHSITCLFNTVFFKSITGLELCAPLKNDESKNNKKSTFRTRGNKVSFWADTGHNGVCLSN